MKLSEEEQIEKLKEVGLSTVIVSVKKKVIETLSIYGEKAIPAITEIIEATIVPEVEEYGLETIKRIKEKSRT